MRQLVRLERFLPLLAGVVLALALAACGGGGGGANGGDGGGDGGDGGDGGGNPTTPPATNASYIVLAWNDLGMHCANSRFDKDVILPPYNTMHAQVVKRGNPPEIVTQGVTVEYRIVGNTTSYDKGAFGGFWDNMQALFGVSLPHDQGLNLVDPNVHNSLAGTMVQLGNGYEVDGIPLTPIDDQLVWSPYQVAEVTVRDVAHQVVARTTAMAPTSDEINCAKCHQSSTSPNAPHDPYLKIHDDREGTNLQARTEPFLCASAGCHVTPALGQSAVPGVKYLSESIHSFHGALDGSERPACYDCHPGATTSCNRSLRHTAADGNCTTCHGSLLQVGTSITAGRVPWVDEPKCATCHLGSSIPEVDTGSVLYRNAIGHGGLSCPACHQSPHAMVPSSHATDNAQAIQYQGKAVSIGSCAVCHDSSKGHGVGEFGEEHGGTNPRRQTACHVCHTAVDATPTRWPHQFKWQAR